METLRSMASQGGTIKRHERFSFDFKFRDCRCVSRTHIFCGLGGRAEAFSVRVEGYRQPGRRKAGWVGAFRLLFSTRTAETRGRYTGALLHANKDNEKQVKTAASVARRHDT